MLLWQDAMAPESGGPEVAMATLTEAVGPIDAHFTTITDQPIAAASLAEVYRATLADGRQVAVKIQRPGLERKVRRHNATPRPSATPCCLYRLAGAHAVKLRHGRGLGLRRRILISAA